MKVFSNQLKFYTSWFCDNFSLVKLFLSWKFKGHNFYKHPNVHSVQAVELLNTIFFCKYFTIKYITITCFYLLILVREGRAGIDLVYDKPETELLKEGEVLRGVQNLFKRDIEQATEQIRFVLLLSQI